VTSQQDDNDSKSPITFFSFFTTLCMLNNILIHVYLI